MDQDSKGIKQTLVLLPNICRFKHTHYRYTSVDSFIFFLWREPGLYSTLGKRQA